MEKQGIPVEKPHKSSNIKKVIGVVSGKGGVGKSLVTSMLAVTMNRLGYNSAVLDADVTGPSISKVFGIRDKAKGSKEGISPNKSKNDIDVMSVNLMLENETDPVLWRGPIVTNAVKQFWTDVMWGEVDFMFIDMPPGTGEVALTVFQSLPIDGIVVVTSPQELVSMIVSKAVKMAEMMNVPVIGLVENMSYFKCDNCDKKHPIFGESHIEDIAQEHNLNVLAKLPILPELAQLSDDGKIEDFSGNWFEDTAKILEQMLIKG